MKSSVILTLSLIIASPTLFNYQDFYKACDQFTPLQDTSDRISKTDTFRKQFLQLCDSAVFRLNNENSTDPFFIDSYAVRALCVAYDMTGNEKYLEACRLWSDRMLRFQKKMIPEGAYYMNYGRKPGEKNGDWYVADCSSIAMGVLSTAVRLVGPERKRLFNSVEEFASLVIGNFVQSSGGVTDGFWREYNGAWWCSSSLFGSFLFMLFKNSDDSRYLKGARDIVNYLNELDLARTGPLPLSHQGPSMPMYVLECYSAGWPYISDESLLKAPATSQVKWCLDWVRNQQNMPISQREWQLTGWWGAKYGGLPFHEYIFSRYLPRGQDLFDIADCELQRLADFVFVGNLSASQLSTFMMMSYAERLDPGAIYK